MKKTTIILLILILLINITTAAQPEPQVINPTEFTLQLAYPKFTKIKTNTEFKFHLHVYNATGIIQTNETTSCYFHLYANNGSHILETQFDYDSNNQDFDTTIPATKLSYEGEYTMISWCNNTENHGGFESGLANAYKTNRIQPTQATPLIIAIGLFAIIILFFGNSIDKEHWVLKFFILTIVINCLYLIGAIALNTHDIGINLYRAGITFAIIFGLYITIFVFKQTMDQIKTKKKKTMKKTK